MKNNALCRGSSLAVFVWLLALTGCESLPSLATPQKPSAKVTDMRLSDVTFANADVLFDVELTNPNPFTINLEGGSYALKINDQSLFEGSLPDALRMQAFQPTQTTIRVGIEYTKILALADSFEDRDEFDFMLVSGLDVRVPGLGVVTLPLNYEGTLPILRVPELRSIAVQKQSLNVTGAELMLQVDIHNPNGIDLNLNEFDYQFKVDQATWAKGSLNRKLALSAHSSDRLEIPISLSFLKMGMTIYRMISDQTSVDYELDGRVKIGSSLPYLKDVDWPILHEGRLSVR